MIIQCVKLDAEIKIKSLLFEFKIMNQNDFLNGEIAGYIFFFYVKK
jgi:hypothetical protein